MRSWETGAPENSPTTIKVHRSSFSSLVGQERMGVCYRCSGCYCWPILSFKPCCTPRQMLNVLGLFVQHYTAFQEDAASFRWSVYCATILSQSWISRRRVLTRQWGSRAWLLPLVTVFSRKQSRVPPRFVLQNIPTVLWFGKPIRESYRTWPWKLRPPSLCILVLTSRLTKVTAPRSWVQTNIVVAVGLLFCCVPEKVTASHLNKSLI